MRLIDQHTKRIMEECKERAKDAGLRFDNETLEYIVTNRNMIELMSKDMIPTLYDYWVQDVETLREKGHYELFPHNPYETVINTRPAISFYNDNNPDWLNVMIFYHVLGHIDFFQNNASFRNTWDDDFTARALVDKRMISQLRTQQGRWVDYVIEFSRSIDNLVGYYHELSSLHFPQEIKTSAKTDYFFDIFLQEVKKVSSMEYLKHLETYNEVVAKNELGDSVFFSMITSKFPEFDSFFERYKNENKEQPSDVLEYIMENSPFIQKNENQWMKSVMMAVRNTSLYFQPQIRTKIFNEGWASYWHERLFIQDDRVKSHEVDFAVINAGVTALSRVGINPYAIGLRLVEHIRENADRGKYSFEFDQIMSSREREKYDKATGRGDEYIFWLRENLNDYNLIEKYVEQDFVDRHRLFVAGQRPSEDGRMIEYYVKSRRADDYRQMLIDSLYHPPHIKIDRRTKGNTLYLNHDFEGKQLVPEFVPNTLIGIEYLWGGPVKLETTVLDNGEPRRTLYTVKDRKITKRFLE
jgi:stage V sporulation protein R